MDTLFNEESAYLNHRHPNDRAGRTDATAETAEDAVRALTPCCKAVIKYPDADVHVECTEDGRYRVDICYPNPRRNNGQTFSDINEALGAIGALESLLA